MRTAKEANEKSVRGLRFRHLVGFGCQKCINTSAVVKTAFIPQNESVRMTNEIMLPFDHLRE